MNRATIVIALGLVAATAAACSSSSTTAASTSAATSPMPTVSTSTPATTAAPTPSMSASASPTSTATTNQHATAAIKAQLLAAAAAYHGCPVSEYVGLAPGTTYLAFDGATATWWAGVSLSPNTALTSPATCAEVSSQDDGAYIILKRPVGGTWKAVSNTGMAGVGGPCPAGIPPATVKAAWGWSATTCHAPGT